VAAFLRNSRADVKHFGNSLVPELIAIITVSSLAYKAANANPVEALKYG
jgi:hypothetical protein